MRQCWQIFRWNRPLHTPAVGDSGPRIRLCPHRPSARRCPHQPGKLRTELVGNLLGETSPQVLEAHWVRGCSRKIKGVLGLNEDVCVFALLM